jgi:DNA-3-methyladenine glycosylase
MVTLSKSGKAKTPRRVPAGRNPLVRLHRAELPVDTAQLARFLIGKMLVRKLPEGVAGGRIVETEAYPVGDAAGHAYRGKTPRNHSLFLERGHAYVYLAYGTAFLLNVSSEEAGVGAGVLIRAIEPILGAGIMEQKRGTERLRDLARGPGRLCAALDIDRRLDGIDLCRAGPLWLGSEGQPAGEIGQSKRIGITRAADSPLRFYARGNPFVSGPRALSSPSARGGYNLDAADSSTNQSSSPARGWMSCEG